MCACEGHDRTATALVMAMPGQCSQKASWAGLALGFAAVGLLALGPTLLPIREARCTVVWARSGRRRRWRHRRWAALALSPAAESLLAIGPALQPIREACCAIIRAWGGHGCRRGRRGRGRHSRATHVVVSTAPNLL